MAAALDLLLGELPTRWHPVAWMGRLVATLESRAPAHGPRRQLLFGAALETLCLATVALPAWLVERWLQSRGLLGELLLALALKPTFAARALFDAALAVERALAGGELEDARRAVGRVVSRRVEELDESLVAAASVESLAENAGDSVVAPLLYHAAFGLSGAYAYRMANTLDAMLGYRGRYEYLGKVPARVDDLLNLVPSRLAAVALSATCGAAGGSPRGAWRTARRDSSGTASPNAGWPMAAAAGALGVRLEKVGHYVLNPEGRPPTVKDMERSRRVVGMALLASVLGLILLSWRWPRGCQG